MNPRFPSGHKSFAPTRPPTRGAHISPLPHFRQQLAVNHPVHPFPLPQSGSHGLRLHDVFSATPDARASRGASCGAARQERTSATEGNMRRFAILAISFGLLVVAAISAAQTPNIAPCEGIAPQIRQNAAGSPGDPIEPLFKGDHPYITLKRPAKPISRSSATAHSSRKFLLSEKMTVHFRTAFPRPHSSIARAFFFCGWIARNIAFRERPMYAPSLENRKNGTNCCPTTF